MQTEEIERINENRKPKKLERFKSSKSFTVHERRQWKHHYPLLESPW